MTTLSTYERTTGINLRHKLKMSVECLVEGKGTLKERLNNIMVSHILPLLVRREKSEIERLIAEAVALATSKPDESGKLGTLYVTLASSHWSTDRRIAKKIFEAYELASRAYYEAGLGKN